MNQNRKPIDYAKASCETMMRKFAAQDLPPKGHFHYHQGVFLSGVYQTYRLCGDERYFQYIKDWVDSIIDENGKYIPLTRGSWMISSRGFCCIRCWIKQEIKGIRRRWIPCFLS